MRGLPALLAVTATALALGACGADGAGTGDAGSGAWRTLPAAPLSARAGGAALWTGREVLVVGGSDARPCPPNASCAVPTTPPLADGAAFDPRAGRWRRIADAPVPFDWAQGVVAGSTPYFWVPGGSGRPDAERAFLAYRIDEDRWERLPAPPGPREGDRAIVAAGDRIVAYAVSDEQGEQPDLLFDPRSGSWRELPPDPNGPAFDRSMGWSGRELILFDHELVPNPGARAPSLTRAAALDVDAGTWRRLPTSEILATGPWVLDHGRLINPTLGGADGGEVGNWGRTYPNGGILDPRSGAWSALPDPPRGQAEMEVFAAGVLTDGGGQFSGFRGWVLDAAAATWLQVPPRASDEHTTGQLVGAAGDDLFVFGGARWDAANRDATLVADAAVWSPSGG